MSLDSDNTVLSTLKQQFQPYFDNDIIEAVAFQCNFDFELSKKSLIDMSGAKFENPTSENATGAISRNRINMRPLASNNSPPSLYDKAVGDINKGKLVLILLRGLPGSGKSTLAKKIVDETIGPCNPREFILSSDDYFYNNGVYQYNVYELNSAHSWNQSRAQSAINKLQSPIIIDNTNTECWEMRFYCFAAAKQGYLVYILEPDTKWAFKVSELAKKNSHRVPANKIQDMFERYERNITTDILFQRFSIKYNSLQPPRMRSYPAIKKLTCDNGNTSKSADFDFSFFSGLCENPNPKIQKKHVGTCTRDRSGDCNLLGIKEFVSNGQLPLKYPKEGHFDKGTSTMELEMEMELCNSLRTKETEESHIDKLQLIFENVPRDYLKDVLDKCNGDVEWTIEILLEDHQVLLPDYNKLQQKEKLFSDNKEEVEEATGFTKETKKLSGEEELNLKKQMESENRALKKHLESNVIINKEHYSEQLLKLKSLNNIDTTNTTLPSSSKLQSPSPDGNGSFILVESDIEFDEDDDDFVDISDESDQATEDMIELNMGMEFVKQLNNLFGDPGMQLPSSFKPVVEIPRALGRQLHALYLESMFKQMEYQKIKMLEEDEDFALKLQLEEITRLTDNDPRPEAPDFKQIMKDQKADALKNKEFVDKEWKDLTPEDMAYKLTIQKLAASFPRPSVETLNEVYRAHGKNYDRTVSALINSGESPIQNTKKTLSASTLKDMKESFENAKQIVDIPDNPSHILRQQAEEYQRKRIELQNKAMQYYSKGMPEVAYFYSDLARKQTQMWEKCNNLAVIKIVSEGFNRVNNGDTIDLHFLRVQEACNALDIYIDEVIHRLQNQNRKHHFIYIITGRGNNSPGGIARIRPSVQNRLKKRKLRYQLANAGLLKVKIFKNSLMTAHLV